ncbi:hypothetical protein [Cohnella boryungensis]|uniref:HNH endonuclease n=1 Tax=Cohnella boryungensis TaxID=768479 RepID=A0ABV8SBL5_9BACL
MISIVPPNVPRLESKHLNYFTKHRFNELKQAVSGWPIASHRPFLQLLMDEMPLLITGMPAELERIRKKAEADHPALYASLKTIQLSAVDRASINAGPPKHALSQLAKVTDEAKLKAKLERIFNYGAFVRGTKDWGAYALVKELNVSVCPYCNRQYTTSLDTRTGKTRPQLDHFYNKSMYPYFSLSLYNLIPSCSVCNSSLKGDKDFVLDTHWSPYERWRCSEDIRFTLQFVKPISQIGGIPDYIRDWYTKHDYFKLDFKADGKVSSSNRERIERNLEVFKIAELYDSHKSYAHEIMLKKEFYSEAWVDMMLNEFPDIFPTRDSVLLWVTGNYHSSADFGNRVLAKLTRDIWEEYIPTGLLF